MTHTLLPRAALAFVLAAAALGCAHSPKHDQKTKELTVDEVVELRKSNSVQLYDVNGDNVRKEHGVIPGAVLLSSATKYEVSQLPADKGTKIAFYCGSQL